MTYQYLNGGMSASCNEVLELGDDSQGFLNSINFTIDDDQTFKMKDFTCFGQKMVIDVDI